MTFDLTRWLDKVVPEDDGPPNLTLRTMTVSAVNANGTVDLTSGGVTLAGRNKLASVGVEVNQQVQVLTGRGVSLVIGPTGNPSATTWTPAITASGTPPTLGTGSSITGDYSREGGLAIVTGRILFGTSGVAVGAGDYRFSLPVAPSPVLVGTTALANGHPIGTATLRNAASAGTSTGGFAQLASGTTFMILAPGGGAVGAATPWAWTANSQINFTLIYPAAT